jgi:hypothetical protein
MLEGENKLLMGQNRELGGGLWGMGREDGEVQGR